MPAPALEYTFDASVTGGIPGSPSTAAGAVAAGGGVACVGVALERPALVPAAEEWPAEECELAAGVDPSAEEQAASSTASAGTAPHRRRLRVISRSLLAGPTAACARPGHRTPPGPRCGDDARTARGCRRGRRRGRPCHAPALRGRAPRAARHPEHTRRLAHHRPPGQ